MPTELQARLYAEYADKGAFEAARRHAYAYADAAFGRRVYPAEADLAGLAGFDEALPETGAGAAEIVDQLHRDGAAGTVATIGGRYFGLVVGSALPASLGARWLADMWDQNSALCKLSPLSAKLEEVCEAWLKNLLGLPPETVAGFVSGSSIAILGGLAAGRERVFRNRGWDLNAKGLRGAPPIRVVTSRQIHATVVKAIAMLGLGIDCVEWVESDGEGRIVADKVPQLDDGTILILQAGNVNSGAFDPFAELCARARAARSWVHVDGAFGLWAAASKRLSHLTSGVEEAQSWSVDGHKTLNTPYDCGILLCRDREALVAALQASGSYIAYSNARDGMMYTPEMSRRARATELWAALKSLGRSGVEALVDQLHDRALQMAAALRAEGFEILNHITFNQILVACGNDAITGAAVARIQDSGECWVGGVKWQGRSAIRISICSWATTEADVRRSVASFVEARAQVAGPVNRLAVGG
jgi:glutamate/tyrosine decarboxylase-like PLP-dependent enzyme